MPKAKLTQRWLIDRYKKIPAFGSVSEAYLLWSKLRLERDYRCSFYGNIPEAIMDKYNLIDDIARALVSLEAVTGTEVADKIDVALSALDEGGMPCGEDIRLLETAKENSFHLVRKQI
jgi:hypothetical protein